MTDIADSRNIIQVEETQYRSAVSESLLTRVGAVSNFISNRQYDKHSWHLNGRFQSLPFIGPDGIFTFLFDAEVAGFASYMGNTGTSGTSEFDVIWQNSDGVDQSTIWSARPQIQSSANDGSFTLFNNVTSTTIAAPSGHTVGVLSKTQFDAGDGIRLDTVSSASGAQNFQFTIMYRPR